MKFRTSNLLLFLVSLTNFLLVNTAVTASLPNATPSSIPPPPPLPPVKAPSANQWRIRSGKKFCPALYNGIPPNPAIKIAVPVEPKRPAPGPPYAISDVAKKDHALVTPKITTQPQVRPIDLGLPTAEATVTHNATTPAGLHGSNVTVADRPSHVPMVNVTDIRPIVLSSAPAAVSQPQALQSSDLNLQAAVKTPQKPPAIFHENATKMLPRKSPRHETSNANKPPHAADASHGPHTNASESLQSIAQRIKDVVKDQKDLPGHCVLCQLRKVMAVTDGSHSVGEPLQTPILESASAKPKLKIHVPPTVTRLLMQSLSKLNAKEALVEKLISDPHISGARKRELLEFLSLIRKLKVSIYMNLKSGQLGWWVSKATCSCKINKTSKHSGGGSGVTWLPIRKHFEIGFLNNPKFGHHIARPKVHGDTKPIDSLKQGTKDTESSKDDKVQTSSMKITRKTRKPKHNHASHQSDLPLKQQVDPGLLKKVLQDLITDAVHAKLHLSRKDYKKAEIKKPWQPIIAADNLQIPNHGSAHKNSSNSIIEINTKKGSTRHGRKATIEIQTPKALTRKKIIKNAGCRNKETRTRMKICGHKTLNDRQVAQIVVQVQKVLGAKE